MMRFKTFNKYCDNVQFTEYRDITQLLTNSLKIGETEQLAVIPIIHIIIWKIKRICVYHMHARKIKYSMRVYRLKYQTTSYSVLFIHEAINIGLLSTFTVP